MSGPERSLVLASASPRRVTLLREAGYRVRVEPADVAEEWPAGEPPEELVIGLARRKARAVSARQPGAVVLAADTEVFLDGARFGKPRSHDDAVRMLRQLSGRAHDVWTGVALAEDAHCWAAADRSTVQFCSLTDSAIENYLRVADYMDKAGAYGIQAEGHDLVEGYRGRLDTIIGLSMNVVETLWTQWEVEAR